jgi:hypothetical protein
MPMGNTREMPKGAKQCQENIEGYWKKLIFIFPSDGGMSNPTKTISTMSKKSKKILRNIKKILREFQEVSINVIKTPK